MKTLLSLFFLLVGLGFFSFRLVSFRQANAQSEHLGSPPISQGTSKADSFIPHQVVPPFEPIVDAPVISADQVKDEVLDTELVLGLTLNESSRAYPINMLTGPSREIINDTLGGVAMAATW